MKWRKGKPSNNLPVIGYYMPPREDVALCYYDKNTDKWFYGFDEDADTRDEIDEPDYWIETP